MRNDERIEQLERRVRELEREPRRQRTWLDISPFTLKFMLLVPLAFVVVVAIRGCTG